MDQHKLYRTIRLLSEAKFRTDEEMLGHILERIIEGEEFAIKGGRIWKLELGSGAYRVVSQFGQMDHIKRNFRIRVQDYPLFGQLHKRGTIITTETNKYLRQKGIRHYSATGVGEKVQWKNSTLFQYVIAINADFLKQDLLFALNIIGHAVTSALAARRIESKAKHLERDLDQAREIQKSILPEHELRFHQYDLYGVSLPDRIVGGDFFDYLQAADDKDRLSVVIGDAASKGLSAAAQALYVSGALRMGVEFQTKMSSLIARVNQLVNKTFTPEHFISMFYAELTTSDNGLVFYVNAGHSNPILYHCATDIAEPLRATGQLLGPFPNERYRAEYALMLKGDILLMYTDGIVEAMDDQRRMYGEARLTEKLRENRSRTPREICQLILEDVQVHSKLQDYSDDKTVVVIKRTR